MEVQQNYKKKKKKLVMHYRSNKLKALLTMNLSFNATLWFLAILLTAYVEGFTDFKQLPKCKEDEYIARDLKSLYCEKCLYCAPGYGSNLMCNNHVIRDKDSFKCELCGNGMFSSYYSHSVCEECSPACEDNQDESQQCTYTTNRHCECKKGIYEGANGMCDQMCCHGISGVSVTHPKCEKDNVDGRIYVPPGFTGECPTLTSQAPPNKVLTEIKKSSHTDEMVTKRYTTAMPSTEKIPVHHPPNEITRDTAFKESTTHLSKEDTSNQPSEEVTTVDTSSTDHTTSIVTNVDTTGNQGPSDSDVNAVYTLCGIALFMLVVLLSYLFYRYMDHRSGRRAAGSCLDVMVESQEVLVFRSPMVT